jgi:hypothetical protein
MLPPVAAATDRNDFLKKAQELLNLPDSAWQASGSNEKIGSFISKNRELVWSICNDKEVLGVLQAMRQRVQLLPQKESTSPFSQENLEKKIHYLADSINLHGDHKLLPNSLVVDSKAWNGDWSKEVIKFYSE